jgi:Ca2+-binding RTX toxin-like protein
MDIWQSYTTFTEATYDKFSHLQIFAIGNGFTITGAANPTGTMSSSMNLVSAEVGAFGTASPAGLVPFTISIPFYSGTMALPNISYAFNVPVFDVAHKPDGSWLVAFKLGATSDTSATANFYTNLYTFGSDLAFQPNSVSNSGPLPSLATDTHLDLTVAGSGDYSLSWGIPGFGVYTDAARWNIYNAGGNPTAPFTVGIALSSSGVPRDLMSTSSVILPTSGHRMLFMEVRENNKSEELLVFEFDEANNQVGSAGKSIWTGTGSAGDSDLQAVANQSGVAVIHHVAPTGGHDLDFQIIIRPSEANQVIVSLNDLLTTPSGDRLLNLEDFIALSNGNFAAIVSGDAGCFLVVVDSNGALVASHAITGFNVSSGFGSTPDGISVAELSDGRLALTGGMAGDVGYLIVDPRPDTIFGTAGNDFITGKIDKAETIFGGDGNDTIYTMSGGGNLYGEAGNDIMEGGDGKDLLFGGQGIDTLLGHNGDDEIHGGTESDDILGGGGYDFLFGDDGDDNLFGGEDSDELSGGDGSDHLYGENDTDFIRGGNGNDFLYGGNGIDLLYGDAGADRFDGGADQDTVTYIESAIGITVDMAIPAGSTGDAAGDTFENVETLRLTNFDDVFFAGSNAASLSFGAVFGGAGDDQIWGRSAGFSDPFLNPGTSMNGGDGNDIFVLTRGHNTVSGDDVGGTQNLDLLFLGLSNFGLMINMTTAVSAATTYSFLFAGQTQTIYGDVEGIVATQFVDNITGNLFDNYIEGGAGADTLNGGGQESKGDTLGYDSSTAAVTVNIATNTAAGGDATGDVISNFENLRGSDFQDVLTAGAGSNVINGGGDNDVLDGGTGSDTLFGDAGQDTIIFNNGLNGDTDTVDGGAGRDLLDLSKLTNGPVWLDLDYNLGLYQMYTMNGFVALKNMESLIGTAFKDTLRGDANSNFINGGLDDDTILGYSPYNLVNPMSSLGDVLEGGGGNDTIFSGTGNDFISGGSGNDIIEVGGGTDTVVTGSGQDTIFFSPRNGTDTVTDFTGGAGVVDVLKLYSFGTALDTYAEVFAASSQQGADTHIALTDTTIILQNFTRATLVADDFVFV